MSLSRRLYRIAFNLATALLYAATARATIRYEVSLAHPEQHLFHVTMTIPDVAGEVVVQLPAWNALYQIRDFSSHVRQVEARQVEPDGSLHKTGIEKIDKQSWKVKGQGAVTIVYKIYWD